MWEIDARWVGAHVLANGIDGLCVCLSAFFVLCVPLNAS